MNKSFKRTDRVAGEIQRKLSSIIHAEVKDPRLSKFVTITDVRVSGDFSYAKVYFTVMTDDPLPSTKVLQAASPFLRTALSRSLKLRTVPELHFVYDTSIEYGIKLSKLINEVSPDDEDKAE